MPRNIIDLLRESERLLSLHHDSRLITWAGDCPVCLPEGTDWRTSIFMRIEAALKVEDAKAANSLHLAEANLLSACDKEHIMSGFDKRAKMQELIALGWQDANDGNYGLIPPPDLWERRPAAFSVYHAEEVHDLITIHDPFEEMARRDQRTIEDAEKKERRTLLVGTYWRHEGLEDVTYFQIQSLDGWSGSFVGTSWTLSTGCTIIRTKDSLPDLRHSRQITEAEFCERHQEMVGKVGEMINMQPAS